MSIQASVEEILEDIKKYSPYPEKVKLIAVTKYSSVEDIEEFLETVEGFNLNNIKSYIKNKEECLHDQFLLHIIDYLHKFLA